MIQIAITPRDGCAINVNDVFDPATVTAHPGWHDQLWNVATPQNPLASPDQRTLEYILGKRPEYSAMHAEYVSYDSGAAPTRIPTNKYPTNAQFTPNPVYDTNQFVANEPAGSYYIDNGLL